MSASDESTWGARTKKRRAFCKAALHLNPLAQQIEHLADWGKAQGRKVVGAIPTRIRF